MTTATRRAKPAGRYAKVSKQQMCEQLEALTHWTYIFKDRLDLWGQTYEQALEKVSATRPRRMSMARGGDEGGSQLLDSDGSGSPPPFP
jgi:hypothetical protein